LFLLLLALCVPLVALHVQRDRALFVIDEFAYSDYLYKVHSGQPVVRRGELHGPETLRLLACRGYYPDVWPEHPPCDSPTLDPRDFPNGGINTADIHPPTYFVVTDLGARALLALGVTDDLVDAGRLFGAVWMAAGLLALWYLLMAVGVNRRAAALALALVAALPSLRWQWQYLTPDAANLLVGSLVVLAALRWERLGRGLPLLAGVGGLALGLKAPNLMVVTATAAYLLARGVLAHRVEAAGRPGEGFQAPRRYVAAAASLLAGGLVASAVWLAVRAALALPGVTSSLTEFETVTGLSPGQVLVNLGRFVNVWDLLGSRSYPLAVIASYLLVGSLLAAVVALGTREPRHTLALVTGVMVVVGPLLLVTMSFVTNGTYALVEARYGASLVPLECAVAASLWRTRWALVPVGALVVVFHAVVLSSLVRP